ncbi:MAG: Lrp/AsnC family transcriptional regulator [Acidimicrobiia bacterium]|nr:Lrp/AsnC family transcriptional regulator [Acidimicrobiia bacterium]
MDNIDRAILYQLQRNGRIANNELADVVGLSPSPCLRRVRNLEAAGAISGYVAILDRDSVGCSYEPMVWVTLEKVTKASLLEFEAAVEGVPEIVEVARMMGQPDYLVRVVTADADHFETLYMDVLANLPHVEKLASQLAMKIIKRTTELPILSGRS